MSAVRAPRLRGRRRWAARHAGRPAPRRRRDRSDGRRAGGAPRRPAGDPARRAPCGRRTTGAARRRRAGGVAAGRGRTAGRRRGRSARPGAGRGTGRRHRGGGDGRASGRAAAGRLGRGERAPGLPAGRSGRRAPCSGCDRPRWPTCRAGGRSSPAAASTCRWRRSSTCPARSRASSPVGRTDAGPRPASPVDRLPERLAVEHLPRPSRGGVVHGGEAPAIWSLPIGLDGRTLDVCRVELHPGEHLLVAGSARSGRSSALVLLAQQVRAADPAARVLTLDPSPLAPARSSAGPSTSAARTSWPRRSRHPGALGTGEEPRAVLLVDDAELVDDPSSVLLGLVSGCSALTVIAAGRVDALRSAYGHWTQVLRRQRRGRPPAPHVRPRRRRPRGHAAPSRSGPGGARAGLRRGRRPVRARAARLARSGPETGGRTRLATVGRTDDTRRVDAVGARDRWFA